MRNGSYKRGEELFAPLPLFLGCSIVKNTVIASQFSNWRGNPVGIPETFGDRHVAYAPRDDV